MQIQKATPADLPQILSLYAAAREFMVRTGNPRQWAARGWPPEALIRQDIENKKCHVCTENGQIMAVFCYDFGSDIDPCYAHIEQGCWLSSAPYGVVHRIAALEGSGAGRFCIRWAFQQCGHLRIDTHADNLPMRKVLAELGFQYRGIIYVAEDSDPRLAFEKL